MLILRKQRIDARCDIRRFAYVMNTLQGLWDFSYKVDCSLWYVCTYIHVTYGSVCRLDRQMQSCVQWNLYSGHLVGQLEVS